MNNWMLGPMLKGGSCHHANPCRARPEPLGWLEIGDEVEHDLPSVLALGPSLRREVPVAVFCPTCRTEYRRGFERCQDCDVALVHELPPQPDHAATDEPSAELVTVFYSENPSQVLEATARLEAAGIPYMPAGGEERDVFATGAGFGGPAAGPRELKVLSGDAHRATQAVADLPGYREWMTGREDQSEALEAIGDAPQACPKCGLVSPITARRCECGAELVPPPDLLLPPEVESAAEPGTGGDRAIRGLEGFLILVGAAVVVSPLVTGYELVEFLREWQRGGWSRQLTPGSSPHHPLWQPYLIFWAATAALLFGWSLALVPMFFWKKQTFPAAAIQFLLLWAALVTTSFILRLTIPGTAGNADGTDVGVLFMAYLFLVATIAYLRVSRRVRDTFVE